MGVQDARGRVTDLLLAGRLAEAEPACHEVLGRDPDDATTWFQLGLIGWLQGRGDEAMDHFRQALQLAPRRGDSWIEFAHPLFCAGDYGEIEGRTGWPTRLVPATPATQLSIGNFLHALRRFEQAAACYRRVLESRPEEIDARRNLGNSLRAAGKLAEALAVYDEALERSPEDPELRFSRSLLLLQAGDFARGWAEHSWQYRCRGAAQPYFGGEPWEGQYLHGATILLHDHQGLGDMIQFVRYARLVADRGGRVVVACPEPLRRILATCPGVDRAVSRFEEVPNYKYQRTLMALPRILGTTPETIPVEVPYLRPDPEVASRWRAELSGTAGFKIGIVWQGNPATPQDQDRSFHLRALEPIARNPGVRLYSLQVGAGSEQVRELEGRFPVIDLGARLTDFMETAGVLDHLDLVIAPDTALAHLAGALARPVWLALPLAPDWRWFLEREDSPWYPTMTLFRQHASGTWGEVLERMARALAARLVSGGGESG